MPTHPLAPNPSTPSDVHAATHRANEAFTSPAFADRKRRCEFLLEIANQLAALGDHLISTVAEETHYSIQRVTIERDRTLTQFTHFAHAVAEGQYLDITLQRARNRQTPTAVRELSSMLMPIGPVAVFGASNFPLAYGACGGDTASALGAGCPVVVKGHAFHPRTGETVGLAISAAAAKVGLHPGVFTYLQSDASSRDHELGRELISSTFIKGGGFTGSLAGGMALANIANSRNIPFFAEMGSVNPVVILPSALPNPAEIDRAARMLAASLTNSAGQMCTCPGLIFLVQDPRSIAFLERLTHHASSVAPHRMLSPAIAAKWKARVQECLSLPSVTSVLATTPHPAPTDDRIDACADILRTNFETFLAHPTLAEESFGPSLIVVECANAHEIRQCIATIQGSLTATLWCAPDDPANPQSLIQDLARLAGRVIWCDVPTGVDVSEAMVHSGPFPACNRPDSTAVGARALRRWCRPVCFQSVPDKLLPRELQMSNLAKLPRRENEQTILPDRNI